MYGALSGTGAVVEVSFHPTQCSHHSPLQPQMNVVLMHSRTLCPRQCPHLRNKSLLCLRNRFHVSTEPFCGAPLCNGVLSHKPSLRLCKMRFRFRTCEKTGNTRKGCDQGERCSVDLKPSRRPALVLGSLQSLWVQLFCERNLLSYTC